MVGRSRVEEWLGGYNDWVMKTVETQPDGNQDIVYSNAYGETMLSVYQDTTLSSPTYGDQWDTYYHYIDCGVAQGEYDLMAEPSAVIGFNDSYSDLVNYSSGAYGYLNHDAGLITLYHYYCTTGDDVTATTAGGVAGYLEDTEIEQGLDGTPILQETETYYSVTAGSSTVNPLATDTVYRDTDGSGAETTTYTYTWFSGTVQMQSETESDPIITTCQNGSGTADVTVTVNNTFGEPIWTKDPNGYLGYTAYDTGTGAVVETITDVNTAITGDFTALPSGWSTPDASTAPVAGGLNLVTTYEVDDQGRTTEETDPDGNITYTVYDDIDDEERHLPRLALRYGHLRPGRRPGRSRSRGMTWPRASPRP